MFGVQKQMFNLLKSTKTTNGFFQNKTNCFSTTSISTSNLLRGFAKVAKTKKSKESKLILTNDVQSLGVKGEAVVVKKGFARNFLLPTKKAVPYNDQNRMEISPPSVSFKFDQFVCLLVFCFFFFFKLLLFYYFVPFYLFIVYFLKIF